MKKILFVTTISTTLNFSYKHIESLIKRGDIVDIASNLSFGVNTDLDKIVRCKHYVPFNRSPFTRDNFKSFIKLRQIINNNNYDIVHVHTPVASVITRLCIKKNIKVVYTAHGYHFYKNAPKLNWLTYYPIERLLSRKTDVIININNEDYERSLKDFSAKKVRYIPGVGIDYRRFNQYNNMNVSVLKEKLSINDNDFVVLMVGELNDNKNQEIIIKTIVELKKTQKNIKLLVAGDGVNYQKYLTMISLLKLEESVKLLGYRTDIEDLMKCSSVLISSSFREGLPVNVMEAMASGLPVIVSNIRGNRDLIQNGRNGYVVENSIKGYKEAIEKLMTSKNIREEISKTNVIDSEKYDYRKIISELLKIY